tara:strand:- start:52 stop:309 length:258 start_codon:yes stop_codon:yes gene_type:complete
MNCFLKRKYRKIDNYYEEEYKIEELLTENVKPSNLKINDEKGFKFNFVKKNCPYYEVRIYNMMNRWKINKEEAIDLIYNFEINQS